MLICRGKLIDMKAARQCARHSRVLLAGLLALARHRVSASLRSSPKRRCHRTERLERGKLDFGRADLRVPLPAVRGAARGAGAATEWRPSIVNRHRVG
jgi:hypothetical protein